MKRVAIIFAVLSVAAAELIAQQIESETARRLDELKKTVQSNGPLEERFRALEQFVRVARSEDAMALLISELDDQSPEVRALAARSLGAIGPKASTAVPALIVRLGDKDYRARWISNHFAMQRAVRFDVAEALGRIGAVSRAARPALTQAAQKDGDPEVRVSAALALMRITPKDDEALGFLIKSLEDDKNGTRGPICAANALQELGARANRAFAALVSAAKHPDEFVRMSAIRALPDVDRMASIEVLTRCLTDKDAQVREAAAEELGKLGPISSSAVQNLILVLDDSDAFVRESAARTLGMIGPTAAAAIPKLEQLAKSSGTEEMRRIAGKSLRHIRNEPANKCVNRSGESGDN